MKYRIVKATPAGGSVHYLVQAKPTAWWAFLCSWRSAASFQELEQARECIVSLQHDDASQRVLEDAPHEVVQ